MMYFKHTQRLLLCCLLCLILIGCISIKHIEQQHYLLDVKALAEKKSPTNKNSIFIEQVTAATPFDQLDFLYRVSSNQYLTDYYHGFLTAPSEQLEPLLVNYLKALGNFTVIPTSLLESQNKLRVQIKEFYADYRNRTHPKAVIVIRFMLTLQPDSKNKVLFDKTLSAKVPLKEKNTSSLLDSWSKGLQDILTHGVRALNTALSRIN